MMDAPRKNLAEELHLEHAELERRAAELESALPLDFDRPQLERLLAELQRCVHRHFELEERGGYFKEALETVPQCQGEIDRLLAEHDRMRHELEVVRHMTRAAADREPIRLVLREWLALLRDHERRENLLAVDVVNRDVGTGD